MTTLAGLVAMRLSHELAGPIGAISTGVDMLGGEDEDIRSLITDSAATLVATLRLHRFVLAPPDVEDAAQTGHTLLTAWVTSREAMTMEWNVKPAKLDPAQIAVLLGLAMCAVEAAPRGGALRVANDLVEVDAKYIVLDPEVAASLRGATVAKPRAAMAGLVRAAADELGVEVTVLQDAAGLRLKAHQGSALPR